jgi:diaminohydroxyphosphoribosylaminopyrimidine deaminase/5-amino-6-(5-phosphoribosylamino)uracil reductase
VIVTGIGTVRADDPELTVRHVEGPSPRRIVLSRIGAVPAGAKVQPCETWTGTPAELVDMLGTDGVLQVMVEAGPGVVAAFHRAGLVNRWVLHVAPEVSGDMSAPGLFPRGTQDIRSLSDNRLVSASMLGDDLEIVLEPAGDRTAGNPPSTRSTAA